MIRTILSFVVLLSSIGITAIADDEIKVEEIKRNEPVDFDREVLPMLRQNCLACHNATDAEGDVVLENVPKILESEAVIPGKPDESPLLILSAHRDDPIMPPADNDVKARDLSPQQLGILKLWISQGAKPSRNGTANKVDFAKLPPGVNPVYALAMSQNGRYLAAGRANQIFVYQLPNKALIDRVTDPNLLKNSPYQKPGIAHLDIVQSLAFAPDNRTFVSGGFRTAKIWKKTPNVTSSTSLSLSEPITATRPSNQGRFLALGGANGTISLFDFSQNRITKSLKSGDKPVDLVAATENGDRAAFVNEKRQLNLLDVASGKSIGQPLLLDQDGISLCFANGNQHLLVGLADNRILVYGVEQFKPAAPAAKPESAKKVDDKKTQPGKTTPPAKPVRVLAGHAKPVRLLKIFGDKDSQLLTASDDGTAKRWNLANGQQLRTFSHGGALCGLEISEDESRVATCGTNGSLKIFNAANSSLIKEIRGDANVDYQIAANDRLVRLKQLLINVAKADLDAANKEKTAEDANVKKTEEALKKATEELQKKLAAKTKADTDFTKTNQPYEAKKAELTTLNKQKTELETALKNATEEQKKLTAKGTALATAIQKSTAAVNAAIAKLNAAKTQSQKDPQNADLKTAEQKAAEELAAITKTLTADKTGKTANDQKLKTVNENLQKLIAQKTELDKKIAAANSMIKQMEANVKKLADAKKKADDEHTAAMRNQTLAKNSVNRARTRAKNVADRIPGLEAAHKAAEAAKAAQEKAAQEFKTNGTRTLSALSGCVRLPGNLLAYRDAQGNVGWCDFMTGEKIDSAVVAELGAALTFGSWQNRIYGVSPDGKKINLLQIDNQWKLARVIGNIDDPTVLVDRVTALDISPDGKLLATGSGEPSRSGEIKIWSLADGKLVKEIKDAHSDTILDLKFSPDGSKIASGSADRFMKTFDLATGKMIRVYEGHTHHVMSVDWNATGRELSSAGADKVVKVWDAETGTQKRTISGYGKEVTSLCFVELSNNIITTSGDRTVRLKRTDNGGELRQFAGNSDFVYAVATSADGKLFAAGGEDSVVRVWSDNGQLYAEFGPPDEKK